MTRRKIWTALPALWLLSLLSARLLDAQAYVVADLTLSAFALRYSRRVGHTAAMHHRDHRR
jgi:hypothetical protein